ncbi:MAG: cytochrome C oxidase subunit IV family protein [Bdellovibrionales bacterium]|nr:cytochrome C oxidase subunit IV family protein [Bdellovibrionales bacterium]
MASGGKHIIPFNVYIKVLLALLALTVVTVLVAQVHFGAFNTVIAMLIASIKAGLVLAIFMHLKYDDKLYVVWFGSAVFFLVVLWLFCWTDFYTRVFQGPIL